MPYANREAQLRYQRRWNKEHYRKNSEQEKSRVRTRKKEILNWFLDYKSTLSCSKCDEKEPVCLDFHHKNGAEKNFNLGSVKKWGLSKERLLKEIDKCIVLCANCHRKEHARHQNSQVV